MTEGEHVAVLDMWQITGKQTNTVELHVGARGKLDFDDNEVP